MMSKHAIASERAREWLKDVLLGPSRLYEALRDKAGRQRCTQYPAVVREPARPGCGVSGGPIVAWHWAQHRSKNSGSS
jgi:hypothetical protein